MVALLWHSKTDLCLCFLRILVMLGFFSGQRKHVIKIVQECVSRKTQQESQAERLVDRETDRPRQLMPGNS